MTFNLIHLLYIGIAYLILMVVLNRKFGIYHSWIHLIKKFPPMFLVIFPPIITYFIVCGSLSMTTVELYDLYIGGLENFNPDTFIRLEKGVEYACSFLVPMVYFSILLKQKFKNFWFWSGVITLTHMLSAGYRDPKLEFDVANPTYRETGPQLLSNFEVLDGIFPLLALIVFYLVFYRRSVA